MTGRAEVRIRVLDENDCEPKFDQEEYRFVMQIDDKGNVSQQPYLETAGSDGGPAADGSVLHVSDCDAPPNGGPFSWSLVDGGGHGKFLVDQRGRLRVNINFGHLVKAEEQIIVQACDGGQRTLCGRAKLFVRTVRADQLTPSLLPSNLTAVLAYPAAGGEKLGRLRLRHPSPKDARLRLLSHSICSAWHPTGSCRLPWRPPPPDGLHRVRPGPGLEQEVRVRVTLLTEAMAESAVPLHLGGGSAHGFFLDRRDAQLAEQLTAQLRLGADARVLLLGVQRGSGGGERQRQLMALLAVYEESRRGFLDPAEVRSRLNSSEAVRSLLPEGGGLGGGGSAGPALLVETAGITFTAPEFRLAPTCGTAKLKGAPPRGRGASCGSPAAAAGGWRCGSHADGDGRLEATAAVSGGGGTEDRDGPESCCGFVSPRPVNDGAWHRVLLRLHDGSPYWTLELLTDSIEPQLGQLPALPASSPSSWDRASTLRVELDRFVGCLTDLLSWPAATRLTAATAEAEAAARRGCPEAELAAPCASTPCQHEGVCTEVGGGGGGFHCSCEPPYAGPRCELNLRPCDHRPCLNGGACRDFARRARGFACDCPAGAAGPRCELVDRGAAAERRPHLVEVEAPANTAAGAWAAAAAARAPAMLGRCATATSTSADRPVGLCDGGRGVCVNLPGGFRWAAGGFGRVSIRFHTGPAWRARAEREGMTRKGGETRKGGDRWTEGEASPLDSPVVQRPHAQQQGAVQAPVVSPPRADEPAAAPDRRGLRCPPPPGHRGRGLQPAVAVSVEPQRQPPAAAAGDPQEAPRPRLSAVRSRSSRPRSCCHSASAQAAPSPPSEPPGKKPKTRARRRRAFQLSGAACRRQPELRRREGDPGRLHQQPPVPPSLRRQAATPAALGQQRANGFRGVQAAAHLRRVQEAPPRLLVDGQQRHQLPLPLAAPRAALHTQQEHPSVRAEPQLRPARPPPVQEEAVRAPAAQMQRHRRLRHRLRQQRDSNPDLLLGGQAPAAGAHSNPVQPVWRVVAMATDNSPLGARLNRSEWLSSRSRASLRAGVPQSQAAELLPTGCRVGEHRGQVAGQQAGRQLVRPDGAHKQFRPATESALAAVAGLRTASSYLDDDLLLGFHQVAKVDVHAKSATLVHQKLAVATAVHQRPGERTAVRRRVAQSLTCKTEPSAAGRRPTLPFPEMASARRSPWPRGRPSSWRTAGRCSCPARTAAGELPDSMLYASRPLSPESASVAVRLTSRRYRLPFSGRLALYTSLRNCGALSFSSRTRTVTTAVELSGESPRSKALTVAWCRCWRSKSSFGGQDQLA
uniref:Cadherin domain-containing protein n=1 Tax=Macrostomum lignano TaxID=282301 RepID=A0A1I8JNX1_9PLAT